jgi:hypothetical protein
VQEEGIAREILANMMSFCISPGRILQFGYHIIFFKLQMPFKTALHYSSVRPGLTIRQDKHVLRASKSKWAPQKSSQILGQKN